MAAYTDYAGWINKQFLGTGEFTLEFGDYKVALTVPDDHIVAATGSLQNEEQVLTPAQRERLLQAQKEVKKPLFIVTPEEAKAAERASLRARRLGSFKQRMYATSPLPVLASLYGMPSPWRAPR